MNKQKFLDKMVDLVEDTLQSEGVSSTFTIEDLLEDEDRCAIRLTYDYSDAEYVKDVADLFRRKKEEDVKVKELYRNSGIIDEIKEFVAEQVRLREERLSVEPMEDYDAEDEYEDEYDDDFEDDDYDDDFDDDLEDDEPSEEESFSPRGDTPGEESTERLDEVESSFVKLVEKADGGFDLEVIGGEGDTEEVIKKSGFVAKKLSDYLVENHIIPREVADNGPELYLITNNEMKYGASAVYDHENMAKFCESIGANRLGMIPSSVNEWIALDLDTPEYEDIADRNMDSVICGVNTTELMPEEVLSSQLYVYCKGARSLTPAKIFFAERENNREV